jgi:hypothetical protein
MSINGIWYNELGSRMELQVLQDGNVTGAYESKVGDVVGRYRLDGRVHTAPLPGEGQAIAWTVAWQNSRQDAHSVTAWSGQYQEADEASISALWLLTMETPPPDSWESTLAGEDVFTRAEPDPEHVQRRLNLGVRASHPLTIKGRFAQGNGSE